MHAPGRLVVEEPTLGDGRGAFCHKGNVVRGIPVDGDKARGRKRVVPSLVDKDPVEADKSGGGPTIRPGKLTIPEGELNEGKVVDGIIEEVGVSRGEVGVVPIRRVAG
jgi:hypothetical protein